MQISKIVAASDESDAGRQAIWMALEVASMTGASVSVLHVMPMMPAEANGSTAVLEQLARWVRSDLPPLHPMPPMTYSLAYGLPGIEIARFAEQERADLLVVGRKQRTRMARLLMGDTADAVARRSRLPCLFVPPRAPPPRRVLVTVDGSGRGMGVLNLADSFARQLGAELGVLTVEPVHAGEPAHLAMATPATRSTRIQSWVHETLASGLDVRRGNPAEQILAAAHERVPDVLVVGCHRGGPAGVIEAGSTARQVLHAAPCAVLTVPL